MSVTNREITAAFRKECGGSVNFITPNITSYGYSLKNDNILFEISYGRGIFSDWIVGVTVLENGELSDKSKCFQGDNKHNLLSLAREYGESLE